MHRKIISIWDLDGTLFDSSHRAPIDPKTGKLDLPKWRALSTPENILQDKPLPLTDVFRQRRDNYGECMVICTARHMSQADHALLYEHGIIADMVFSRDKCRSAAHYMMPDGAYKAGFILPFLTLKHNRHASVVMFDDAPHVKTVLRRAGVPVVCAVLTNARLKGF